MECCFVQAPKVRPVALNPTRCVREGFGGIVRPSLMRRDGVCHLPSGKFVK
jgi:hypothetical protein